MKLSKIILSEEHDYFRYDKVAKKYTAEAQKLAREYDPRVSMGYYVEDGPKAGTGFGKVTFMVRKDVPEEVTKAIIDKVLPKDFEIEYVENMYDVDPGERDYFPQIKFEFPVNSVEI